MAEYAEIMDALRKADAAGNVEDARKLAAMARAKKAESAPKPAAPQFNPNAERARLNNAIEADNSFLENAGIKYIDTFAGAGRGLKGLAARAIGDEKMLKDVQQSEAENRMMMEPVDSSAGGIVGNLAGNAAMLAVPAGAIGKLGQAGAATSKLATLAKLMGLEGALGAATGAIMPTVEGESVGKNMAVNAALNAVMPVGGAALKSKPMQKAADVILDYTPFLAGKRLQMRNDAGRAGVEAEKVAAALRADAANAERDAMIREGQKKLAERAGWDRVPTDKLDMEDMHRAIGKQYGDLIEPVKMDVNTIVPEFEKMATKGGLATDEANRIKSITARIRESADGGQVSGGMYKTLRSEINDHLTDAKGLYREQLTAMKDKLDESFNAAIPDDQREAIGKLRDQYALGSKMKGADFDPSKGFDTRSMRKRLDAKGGARDARQELIDLERMLPAKAKPDYIAPFDVEHSNQGVIGGLAAAGGVGMGSPWLLGLPLAAGAVKSAKNDKFARFMADALRTGNTTYTAPYIGEQ